jgi:hypothetical protein
MSFALTTKQFVDGSKTVTRRCGWWHLKVGDVVWAVEKGMGLKKDEKVKKLSIIKIISVRAEPLCSITQDDVIAEGFPTNTPADFIAFYANANRCETNALVNRIEFKKIEML